MQEMTLNLQLKHTKASVSSAFSTEPVNFFFHYILKELAYFHGKAVFLFLTIHFKKANFDTFYRLIGVQVR